jgi:peptidoglycan/LPS O-acetylase OafA/YrhL
MNPCVRSWSEISSLTSGGQLFERMPRQYWRTLMKLANYVQGRDNNFNLIRIVAAYAVLVTHGFALTVGIEDAEPFRDVLGMTIGSIAVDVFFITSGFLVTASLLTRQNTIEFIWSRILRIYPALLVMLVLTVLGLGPFLTTVPLSSYFSSSVTYTYFLKCLTLFSGVAFELPGVFEKNPYQNAVNGSLWTMPYEVRLYALLILTWIILGFLREARVKAFRISVVLITVLTACFFVLAHLDFVPGYLFFKLSFMFFTGASFFVLKEKIELSKFVFYFLFLITLVSMLDKQIFFIVYTITIPYLLFFIAYFPSGFIRKYNKLGDYSYGIYIYAFPVQQSIILLNPGISILSTIVISSTITLIFAVLSWHFLEKNALKLKKMIIKPII